LDAAANLLFEIKRAVGTARRKRRKRRKSQQEEKRERDRERLMRV
jgi:hypothetical protein